MVDIVVVYGWRHESFLKVKTQCFSTQYKTDKCLYIYIYKVTYFLWYSVVYNNKTKKKNQNNHNAYMVKETSHLYNALVIVILCVKYVLSKYMK